MNLRYRLVTACCFVLAAGIPAFAEEFWSFQRPEAHDPPTVRHDDWPQTRIDAFILARLEGTGLEPSPPAEKRMLIRRLCFDLTGLPPTPEQVDRFVELPIPDVVERLLASPAYGERWARLWLDVARYAEDQAHIVGNNKELFYPNAYLYRDWVIQAFNEDLPYDEFVKRQLAADLMEGGDAAHLPALGFIGLGPKYYRRNSPEVMADEWEDRVDTVARGLLGLTVACARCHDHKFDPIPTSDYYALAGVFASTEMFNRPIEDEMKDEDEDKDEDKDKKKPDPEKTLHIVREGEPRDLNVFVRGDVKSPGPVAERRFLTALSEGKSPKFDQGSGRLQLAEAIASRDNPLTARVIVNRIWALHFGQPLVRTPSNFGALGEPPTHPELLDDLAVRFMDAGWSLKWLHREIVLSATYQQTSTPSLGKSGTTDAANTLLGRMNRRRLSIEQWRDTILATTGRLERGMGGASINPLDLEEDRRTTYSYISRLDLNPMLAMFDFPDPNAHAAKRVETTTPLQKMFVLNSPFMVRHAETLAERLEREADSDEGRIERAYELLFARSPTEAERRLGLAYVNTGGEKSERWVRYAHVLLASNEMLFLD